MPVVAAAKDTEVQDIKIKNSPQVMTSKERLSAYFTIAAAGFGMISDGCKYHINPVFSCAYLENFRSKQSYDHGKCIVLLIFEEKKLNHWQYRLCLRDSTQTTTLLLSLPESLMLFLLV